MTVILSIQKVQEIEIIFVYNARRNVTFANVILKGCIYCDRDM